MAKGTPLPPVTGPSTVGLGTAAAATAEVRTTTDASERSIDGPPCAPRVARDPSSWQGFGRGCNRPAPDLSAGAMNHQIILAERPTGRLEPRHFRTADGPVGEPGPGEVLCRTILLSIDPANRAWMQGATYRAAVEPGQVMAGFTLSEVVRENATGIAPGTVVACEAGWQEYALLRASAVRPVTVRGPLTHHLSVLGITGLTAHVGLLGIGRPKGGETVVVSAAAGATGNVVGQIARIHGCRVVDITGSDEKNRMLERDLRFDATANHRSATLRDDVAARCPRGVDVYFDNVGGRVLEAVLPLMNLHGRIVCCGAVSQYD